jgi:hypothetical protein
VFFCQHDELIESKFAIAFIKLLTQETDGGFIKIKGHVRDHFLVIGLDVAVSGSGRVNGHDIQEVFAFCG